MYRIGLDIRMLQNTGIGTYLRGILSGFRALGVEKDLALFGSPKAPGEETPVRVPFSAPIYSVQEQFQYPGLIKQCALWHAPHYNVPLWKGKAKLVVTIHDIIHWIFRKQFFSPLQTAYAGFMLRRAVAISDHMIAVSHHTKKDLVEHFRAPAEKITVIHQGVEEAVRSFSPEELTAAFQKIQEKYRVPGDYFLYVGLIKPHKNVLMLVRLFRKLKAEGKVRASLVLVGRKDRSYPAGFEELATLVSTKDILHLPLIDPYELAVLYRRAVALVHPSLYEGFGLTLLEAMSYGTPVLTTNSSSIPEVVGDAACRVDATDEPAMMQAIARLDRDPGSCESLRQKGFERVKMFSWKETARKTAAVYERVLAGR